MADGNEDLTNCRAIAALIPDSKLPDSPISNKKIKNSFYIERLIIFASASVNHL